jgi:hypothetical protein
MKTLSPLAKTGTKSLLIFLFLVIVATTREGSSSTKVVAVAVVLVDERNKVSFRNDFDCVLLCTKYIPYIILNIDDESPTLPVEPPCHQKVCNYWSANCDQPHYCTRMHSTTDFIELYQ